MTKAFGIWHLVSNFRLQQQDSYSLPPFNIDGKRDMVPHLDVRLTYSFSFVICFLLDGDARICCYLNMVGGYDAHILHNKQRIMLYHIEYLTFYV